MDKETNYALSVILHYQPPHVLAIPKRDQFPGHPDVSQSHPKLSIVGIAA